MKPADSAAPTPAPLQARHAPDWLNEALALIRREADRFPPLRDATEEIPEFLYPH